MFKLATRIINPIVTWRCGLGRTKQEDHKKKETTGRERRCHGMNIGMRCMSICDACKMMRMDDERVVACRFML
jgi:hypothetical protein